MLGGLDNATVAVIPPSMEFESDRPSEGLDLTLLAPWGHLSIWIPQLLDERRAQVDRGSPSDSSGGSAPVQDGNKQQPSPPPTKKNQKSKKTKKKNERKKSTESDDELPLSPALEIEFPEGRKE
jgi:hypothetical protein